MPWRSCLYFFSESEISLSRISLCRGVDFEGKRHGRIVKLFRTNIYRAKRQHPCRPLRGDSRANVHQVFNCLSDFFSILLDDIWKCEKCFVILGEKNNLGRRDNFKLSDFIRLNHYGSALIVSSTVSSMTNRYYDSRIS